MYYIETKALCITYLPIDFSPQHQVLMIGIATHVYTTHNNTMMLI